MGTTTLSVTRTDLLKIPLTLIDAPPSSNVSREKDEYDEAEMAILINSMTKDGMLMPVIVRRDGQRFKLVAGFRRFRAAKKLKWQRIDARPFRGNERDAAAVNVAENVNRHNLTPWQLARSMQKLSQIGFTDDEIAERLGRAGAVRWVQKYVSLLSLTSEEQKMLRDGILSTTGAASIADMSEEDRKNVINVAKSLGKNGRLTGRNIQKARRTVNKSRDKSGRKKHVKVKSKENIRSELTAEKALGYVGTRSVKDAIAQLQSEDLNAESEKHFGAIKALRWVSGLDDELML